MDLDFQSAFDFLCMDWVYAVFKKKGLDKRIIDRIKGYYAESYTIPIVNNIPTRTIKNIRITLRQGDCPSSLVRAIEINTRSRLMGWAVANAAAILCQGCYNGSLWGKTL